MAAGLKNLAGLVESQMKAEESFFEFSYDLSTQSSATPCVVEISSTLGPEICLQGKYEEAEALYLRATDICEETLGSEHPFVATILSNMAVMMNKQVRAGQIFPDIYGTRVARTPIATFVLCSRILD